MCGIAGFVGSPSDLPEPAARVRAMCDAITHRGPDSDGYLISDGVALGMRRLSIIDVAGGHQPIFNEDGSIGVVFNGEIYNHRALRSRLEAMGHTFKTRSDTEVLVHLYEQYGDGMAIHLHGMFTFAIWDAGRRELFMARDRTGMKPLSYLEVDGGLIFCSELRSMSAFSSDLLRVRSASVMEYLAFGYVPDPDSIFENVKKLPPAHQLLWSAARGVQIRRYWTPPHPQTGKMDEGELVSVLCDKLDAAVASHLESEVPLGAFLSGGLDSATVVALMARHASGRVKTFSIGFTDEEFDESAAARAVAKEFGTEHTELVLDPNVEELFDDIASMFDEPFADVSAIPTFLVAKLARESVTVALSGDGGDELFGGYTRYRDVLNYSRLSGTRIAKLAAAVGLMLPHSFIGRNRLIDIGRTALGRYAARVVQPVRIDEGGVARSDLPEAMVAMEAQLRHVAPVEMIDDLATAMMRIDVETYLPGDILTKVDRTTMAVSLEARVPLLACDLVDFALSLPGDLRVTAQETKRLFRRAIARIVPPTVLARPKKGFGIPIARWFRGPLRHRIEALRTLSPALKAYVDQSAVSRLVAEHIVGRRDHSVILWRLIVLDNWLAALARGRLRTPPTVSMLSAA